MMVKCYVDAYNKKKLLKYTQAQYIRNGKFVCVRVWMYNTIQCIWISVYASIILTMGYT